MSFGAALLAATLAMVVFGAPGARAESDPFFPSSSSTSAHTTIKAIGKTASTPSPKSTGTSTGTSSTSQFSIPASARVKPTASTPATSTTNYRPTESAALPSTGAGPTRTGAVTNLGRPLRRGGGSSSPSTAAIIAAIVAALLVLGSLVWVLTRWLVFEPKWALSLRYSLEEANFRVSATVAEFVDWVRLGR